MANQYGGGFLQFIQDKYHCSAEELLKQFSHKGLSVLEVVDELGCSESVVRKYAKLYQIDFVRKAAPEYKLKKAKERKIKGVKIDSMLQTKWV